MDTGIEGLIHISEISERRVTHPKEVVSEGDVYDLRIIRIEGADVLVADLKTLDDYSTYLDLRRKYDPEPGQQREAAKEAPTEKQALKRLLKALHISVRDMKHNEAALAAQYNQYQQLKRRFHDQDD